MKFNKGFFVGAIMASSFLISSAYADVNPEDVAQDDREDNSVFCIIDENNEVNDVNACLKEVRDEASEFMPLEVSEDTELLSMVVIDNKIIQNYNVTYGGRVDFDNPETFSMLEDIYLKALPETANKTCFKGTLTAALYKAGMINEYRYRVNDSEKFVSIIVDKQYCKDVGLSVD